MLKSHLLIPLVACATLLLTHTSLLSQEPAPQAEQAVKHLHNKEFQKAIKILEGDLRALQTKKRPTDYLHILKARAYLLSGQPEKAITATQQLQRDFPESKWTHKAEYIRAQALTKQKNHNAASAIYEQEASTLFSPKYKDQGAQLLLEIAATLSAEPKPDDLDALKPDYRTADNLLREAFGMDCSEKLRETILTERIRLNTKMESWKNVATLSYMYLDLYDKTWRGKIDSLSRLTLEKINKNAQLHGENVYLVRYHLAEALHRSGERLSASRYLREMISDLNKSNSEIQTALLADATWLHLMASREQGGEPRDLEQWVADTKSYLKKFPTHIHANSTVYTIAILYQQAAEDKLAIEAYQHFLNNHYQLKITPNPLTHRPESKEAFAARQEKNKKRKEEVSYRIGKIYLEMNEFAKAKEAWNLSSKNFPNGARWADCQRGLVDIAFQQALYDISKITEAEDSQKAGLSEAAQLSLAEFITAHSLDSRVPVALYLSGNIPYQHALALNDPDNKDADNAQQLEIFKSAIQNWEKLISSYPKSIHAKDAQYHTASIYENQFQDLEKALTIYKSLRTAEANNRIAVLTLEKLVAYNDKTFTTTEKPYITLNTRNVEAVTVSQYWVDIESYFRKGRNLRDISTLDIDLVEADKTWELKLPDYKKYHLLESKIDVPFANGKAGLCIVKIESENFSTTTMVMRSDIDIAMRTSKNNEILAYVYNEQTKSPAKGIKLLIANETQVLTTGTTDANGVFHTSLKELTGDNDIRILALSTSGAATCSAPQALLPDLDDTDSKANPLKAFINIPKREYRPSENLPISGIVRLMKDSIHTALKKNQRDFTLSIFSENKLLHRVSINLDDNGVFRYDYQLPSNLSTGSISLKLKPDFDEKLAAIEKYVSITRESQDKVALNFKMNKPWVEKGELIEGKITATYHWGAPYAGKVITVNLPKNLHIDLITDDNGEATFSYDPQYNYSGQSLAFTASTPSDQARSLRQLVLIDPVGFIILASTDRTSVAAGTPIAIDIKTLLPDTKITARDLTLKITQTKKPNKELILRTCKSLEDAQFLHSREIVIEETKLKTDPKSGESKHTFTPQKAGIYQINITGKDDNGKEVYAQASITAHDASLDHLKLVIEEIPTNKKLYTDTNTDIVTWSYFNAPVTALFTVSTDSILEKRLVTLQPGKNNIPLKLRSLHAPHIQVHLSVIHDRQESSAIQEMDVINNVELVATIQQVSRDENNDLSLKLMLKALDSDKKAVAADFFINLLEHSDQYNHSFIDQLISSFSAPYGYSHTSNLSYYNHGTSCGLEHYGKQKPIRTDVRDELARLNRSESDTIQRYNNPILNAQARNLNNPSAGLNFVYRDNSDYPFESTDDLYRSGSNFRGNGKFIGLYSPPELPNIVSQGAGQVTQRISGIPSVFPVTPATPPSLLAEYKSSPAWLFLDHIPAEGKEIIIEAEEAIAAAYKLQILGFGDKGSFGKTELDIAQADYQITSNAPTNAVTGDTWFPRFTMTRVDTEKAESIDAEITLYSNKTKHTFAFKEGEKTATITLQQTKLTEFVSTSIKTQFAELANEFTVRPRGIPRSKKIDRKLAKGEHKFSMNEGYSSTAVLAKDITQLIGIATSTDLASSYGEFTPLHDTHPAGQLMAATSYLQFLIDHKLQPDTHTKQRYAISQLCAELTLSIKADNGWSEVRNRRESSLLHTATAYQALVMADKLKIDFEKSTLKRALSHLQAEQKELPIEHYNSRAFVQFALAFSGDADFAICNRLYREREKMDNIGKAILANAFILLDRKEFALNLLKEIKNVNTVRNQAEQFLNSPTLLDALISQAKSETDPAKANTHPLTVKFSSDIDRGFAVRSYTARFNNKPVKELADNISIHPQTGKITVKADFAYITEIETDYQPAKPQAKQADFYITDRKYYADGPNYKGKSLRASGTSESKTLAIGETVRVSFSGKISNKNYPDTIIIEEIPAGFDYQPGSLRGNHSGARKEGNYLVITYGSVPDSYKISYTLIASRAGTWHHRQSILTPAYDISKNVYNKAETLTVLKQGKKSNTPYKLNANEHYELARLNFNDNNYEAAKQHIISYRKLKKTTEDPVLAEMLLWIETASPEPDAQLLADSFEVLTERNPDLVIPFDKILKVGSAYRDLKEYERSKDVFTATLESGYNADSYVGAALEDQGKFMLSVNYQDKLWLLYPDLGEITTSRFALSQQIYAKISSAKTLGKNPTTKKPYTEKEITTLSLQYMEDFITHAPTHELASDAAFSIANALFALKRYKDVVEHTKQAAITYKDSTHATSFRYMEALGHFWLRNYKEALASASDVAKGKSEDKNLAAFITAQIYHANNQPAKALEWYNGIKDNYPDAKESIAYFEQKSISLDEVKILNSGDKAKIKLKYRNIKEAQFQIYRVDLMKLYLREKNLSNISKINLAGINPKHNLTVKLGEGKDFKEIEKDITLPVEKDGAYLVICRGDYIHTSGLVLITPLKMDVQEYPVDNSVRVNITDKKTGEFLDSVHVKAVGKDSANIKSGETDLRGVWQGENIASPATIIARDTSGRYAFFRSKIDPSKIERSNDDPFEAPAKGKVDFNRNLNTKQRALQKSNLDKYEEKRRSKGNGVEIKKAWKK